MAPFEAIYRVGRDVLRRLINPLRADEQISQFTLSVPEAQTTTVDSVQGEQLRPPAVFRGPNCDADIHQQRPLNAADCPECYRTFDQWTADDLELIRMTCPRCESEMRHGRRHPRVFDRPEYASCPSCQYHWDLDHWF
jgi:hypothetical protein